MPIPKKKDLSRIFGEILLIIKMLVERDFYLADTRKESDVTIIGTIMPTMGT